MAEPKHVELAWRRELVFESGTAGRPSVVLDGNAAAGPSPMEALLLALAGCTGADVVSILKKKRADLRAFRVEVVGERRDEHPKRYTAITLRYHVSAPGLGEEHARRAIDLSLEKYCSVTHSLAKDIAVRYELLLDA
jgi:putative redox protein